MLFNSPEFFLFLLIVLALYYVLNRKSQNVMLLAASYIFYGMWDYRFLFLILLSTVVDFSCSLRIHATNSVAKRRLLLLISLFVNLGILSYFKYANFFLSSTERIFSQIGLDASFPTLYIILPVGISFYTFQTMAYTIDVYRDKFKPTNNLLNFALYVCYFPQLVAGPIERPENLIPAIENKRTVTIDKFNSGLVLILIGLFRKVVIADGIGAQVDLIFSGSDALSTPYLIKGVYLFALQIYCDFAGYSDIARGTSRLLGIELMRNFNQPYFSSSITEFWRRWHISLSTWLRDYLYIPLGGNRNGKFNTYRNLMITMLLGGLWHGAAWTFVVWGGLHGSYLICNRLIQKRLDLNIPSDPTVWNLRRVAGTVLTFHLVLLAWIFFRAPGLSASLNFIRGILAFDEMGALWGLLPSILIPWALVMLVDIPQFVTGEHTFVLRLPKTVRRMGVAVMLFTILLGVGTRAPFIYFQF